MGQEIVLQVRNLDKSFGGIKAVNNVSFDLAQGKILGIIGPNGSGKTTLANLITGFDHPNSGEVLFKGKFITDLKPHKIANLGICRTFQIVRPYHSLPAYKNLIIPLLSLRVRATKGGKYGDRDAVAIDLLESVGFERDAFVPYKKASTLPLGYLKRLELARCLALKPEVIICDEVFSGLSMAEIATMVPTIDKLRDNGITFIMIEHRLRELFRLADNLVVLNFGEIIAKGKPEVVLSDEKVKEAYLGAEDE